MCDRSACSSVTGADISEEGARSGCEPFNTLLVARITDRSMKFCNSRTLPGQE
jgi:hypothetical protein